MTSSASIYEAMTARFGSSGRSGSAFREGMVGGASSAFISQRLRAAQARALREHGIDPSSIPVGRVVAMGRHHGIFLKNLCSTNRKFLAVAGRADGFRGYPAVGTTLASTSNDGKGWRPVLRRRASGRPGCADSGRSSWWLPPRSPTHSGPSTRWANHRRCATSGLMQCNQR